MNGFTRSKSRQIALIAIFAALVVVLQVFGSNFRIATVSFSFVLVPIVLGGMVGGVLGAFIFCKRKKIKLGTILDMLVPIVLLCQAIGRWGNFCNQEAYGQLVTNEKLFGLPFSVYIDAAHAVNGAGWYQATFLYESVYNFIGAILTYCLWRKNKVNGALVFFYGVWYCVIRLILDFLRVDGLLSTKIACVIVIPTFTALGIWYYLHGLKKLDHDKAALEVEEMLASDD